MAWVLTAVVWIAGASWLNAQRYSDGEAASPDGYLPGDSSTADSEVDWDPRFAEAAPSQEARADVCEAVLDAGAASDAVVSASAGELTWSASQERAECVVEADLEASDGRVRLSAALTPSVYPDFEERLSPADQNDPCEAAGVDDAEVVEYADAEVCFERPAVGDGARVCGATLLSHSSLLQVQAFVESRDDDTATAAGEELREVMLDELIADMDAL